MSKKKGNWPVTIGVGITLGLAILVISKNAIRPFNNKIMHKIQLDLKAMEQSVRIYKKMYGAYPLQAKDRTFNFAEQLSDVQPSIDNDKVRRVYIDYDANRIITDNPNYAAPNAGPTRIIDPFGEPYFYTLEGESVFIWSCGPDKVNSNRKGDDIHWEIIPGSPKPAKK